MDGMEMLSNIKGDDRLKHIPVMMVTSETGGENIIRAIQAGAAHYLVKPFTIEELAKRILECLGRARHGYGQIHWIVKWSIYRCNSNYDRT